MKSKETVGNFNLFYRNGDDFKNDWQKHFLEVYGLNTDLSCVRLPPVAVGFNWGVIRVPELSGQKMFEVLSKRFKRSRKWCDNLDKILNIGKEARTTKNGPYAGWLRDCLEVDEKLNYLSAKDIIEQKIKCVTLSERIALEGWYEWKFGHHLNIKTVSLNAGSRCVDGTVPTLYWSGTHGLCVDTWLFSQGSVGICGREIRVLADILEMSAFCF
ncbi:MAG: hypothetical protein COV30_00370 [Candidatus Yanofskybacteria bacterium CG10_big_fil_rev_8_21_14_0_10_37_15]|uniref:Uncharacterized protein n=1 Tax=Candidatus Yanofskybacteria bacterium CG10_big_fil_rev_8_21_14_0_10_37_15 TaxID=1975097 RepID=A0A2H0R7R1_9BACT|nr:MAG: hypothetical protein COV30_00370 [Candidatus Yanofskybacteria bacterium CG10_big_fil_rev_8_21_14_0_10_37_15]